MSWTRRLAFWAPFLAACLLLPGCTAGDGGDADTGAGFRRIVVVGIDGLRGDHLGRSGYPRATSPFLDALAERSVAFERAYAASSRSLTSYASLFTGRAPGEHGLWYDASGPLDATFPTTAEQLAERGYRTAAFVSTRRDWAATGLSRGFEHFAAPSELYPRRHRPGGETVVEALAWLRAQPADARSFVWVQIADPTKPFKTAFAEPPGGDFVRFLLEEQRIPFGYFHYDNSRLLRLMNRYDGEVRAADFAVDMLYQGLERAGWGAGTLWVVTSPHGMGLGNHLWEGPERQLYEVQVRVPLLFHAPGGELVSRSVQDVVSHLDLASTLIALSAGEQHPLGGLLVGGERSPRPALVQRGTLGPLPRRAAGPGRPGADPGQLDGLVEQRWKLLRHSSGAEQLYDVVEDPYETRDLREDADAETLARLRAELAERLAFERAR